MPDLSTVLSWPMMGYDWDGTEGSQHDLDVWLV